eukprot:6640249-Prorocentrum_lima.AAC.1
MRRAFRLRVKTPPRWGFCAAWALFSLMVATGRLRLLARLWLRLYCRCTSCIENLEPGFSCEAPLKLRQ